MWLFKRKHKQTSTPSLSLENLPLPRPNVVWQEPWSQLEDVNEQHSLQRELLAELSAAHPLWNCNPVVLGRSSANDDVLVSLNNGRFATVHLVWHGHVDQFPETYPTTVFYDSLEELQEELSSYEKSEEASNLNLEQPSSSNTRTSWAYVFTCAESLETLLTIWNEMGVWTWELRDSAWYGDYLNTQPSKDVRVRIHEFPQGGEVSVFVGEPGYERGYTALAHINAGSSEVKRDIDHILHELLKKVSAERIEEIEPYD